MAARSRATVFRTGTRLRLSSGRAAPIALFCAALLLYITTLTQVHTFDALSYVTSVERKPWTAVFHPHHLAYGPLGVLTLALGRALGYAGGAALPLQLTNALAGALGVALFFALTRRVSGRADLALAAALLLGGAYAYWYYAVEIEVYTVATLFLLLCLAQLARGRTRAAGRRMLLLGLTQGGAILFHQTNLLFCAPVLVYEILDLGSSLKRGSVRGEAPHTPPSGVSSGGLAAAGDTGKRDFEAGLEGAPSPSPRFRRLFRQFLRFRVLDLPKGQSTLQNLRSRMKQWAAYVLALGLTVGLPYLFVGVVVSGFRSWGDFEAWLTEYARTGWWGGPITAQKWADLGKGLAETLAQPGGALLWLLLLGLAVLHLRRLAAAARPLVGALLAWLLVYGAFFLWWEPDNIEFWIASLPPALLLLALALRRTRPWGPEVWVALAVAATALGVNHDAIVRRGDASTDLQRAIAQELGAHSQPADLLLIPDGLLELYLPYYEQRENFLSLNQAMFDAGEDWGRACATIHTRIDVALHAGASVLAADEVLRPPELLLSRHHLAQQAIDQCLADYRGSLAPLVLHAGSTQYWRLPTGQELAQGAGWRFDRYSSGWQPQNVRDQRFDGGWRFVPGADPALTSPLLDLDARSYAAIEIRIANTTHARDAQLFFAGPDGHIDEAHSVLWQLAATRDAVTYRVELAGQPGWAGPITRLRLDPVGVGDGGEVRVEWIRLLAR